MPEWKSLRRSRRTRIIAGVCGGIAVWLNLSPTLVRLLFVVGSILPVIPGPVVYVVLWIVVPEEP